MPMTEQQTRTLQSIGQSVPRLDGLEKVRGLAEYADDIPVPDLWFGHVVRSECAHGRLRGLRKDAGFDWSLVTVVTPEDIPGENIVDLMGRDMPMLAHDEVRYLGEPVALVAAPTRALAREAASMITPEIEALPALESLEEVVARFKAGGDGLDEFSAKTIRKGDTKVALAKAGRVIEGEYWCGHQEQMYIEPQGMTVIPEEDGSLFIVGSMQCPYYINPELCVTLDLPPDKLRVKQSAVGGAFGGKEEFPTLLAGYCALLAMKCGKPVRIVYDRHQDILYSTKRHPAWVRHRTGLNADGSIAAMEIEYVLDGGAYTTLSPVVLYRGILHAAMGYRCDHVFVDGRVFRTHTFPNGAFRGFGAPQALWALESHIDECAEACSISPDSFRLKNCLRDFETTPTGQVLGANTGSTDVLARTVERADFVSKLKQCSQGRPGLDRWYGIGMSFFAHGSGFTGDGEARIKSRVALDLARSEAGRPEVLVRVSSTEMGQGTFTILPQIVADGLSIPLDFVTCPYPDTSLVPDSGPTVASRTAMVVGGTLHEAATDMKRKLEAFAADAVFEGQAAALQAGKFEASWGGEGVPFETVAARYIDEHGPLRVYSQFKLPPEIRWDQDTFEGDAYPAYAWGCNIAEVEVDTATFEIHVRRIVATHDIGRVINPVLAEGQVQGGLVQALGYAIMEKMQVHDGRYDANRMQTYVIPTTLDVPPMDLEFVEYPYELVWPGAKGVGEIPMDGLAPAIANALKRATGTRFTRIPITPEDLYAALVEPAGAAHAG